MVLLPYPCGHPNALYHVACDLEASHKILEGLRNKKCSSP